MTKTDIAPVPEGEPTRASLWRTAGRRFLAPLIVFLLHRGLASLAASWTGFSPFVRKAWIRWDAFHYIKIARSGYEVLSCQAIGYPSINDFCGNTTWFPGYPFLLRPIAWLTGSYAFAAVLVPPVFFATLLVLFWNVVLEARGSVRDWLTLLLVAFFPGTVYVHTAFPVAMEMVFILMVMVTLERGRYAWCAVFAFLAGFTYPPGFLAGMVVALVGLLRGRDRLKSLGVAVAGAAGLLAVILWQWITVHVWMAFLKNSTKYGMFGDLPGQSLVRTVLEVFTLPAGSGWRWVALQTLVVTVLAIAFIAATAPWRQVRAERFVFPALIMGVAYWIFPHLLGGGGSFYRGEALVFPVVMLHTRLSNRTMVVLLAVFLVLFYAMSGLFFRGALV
jgi:hypothetical protein